MRFLGSSSLPVRAGVIRGGLGIAVLALVVGGSAFAFASGPSKVDMAILQMEQVDVRLSAMPSMVGTVAKAATERGNAEASKVAPLLEEAARGSFKASDLSKEILDDLAEADDGKVDPGALSKAAAAFVDGREKIDEMYRSQDQAKAKEIEARVGSAEDGPRITQLAEMMASPDLAVETALTAQVMYASLEAASDAEAAELTSAPKDKLQSELQGVVTSLRGKTENEKPLQKDVARMDEKARITFALATLSSQDLSVLADFYQSEEGKAKRKALVESYGKASDQANTRMLGEYFSELAIYLKANPRSQQ